MGKKCCVYASEKLESNKLPDETENKNGLNL